MDETYEFTRCVVCCSKLYTPASGYCEEHGEVNDPSFMPIPFAEWFGPVDFGHDRHIIDGRTWNEVLGYDYE